MYICIAETHGDGPPGTLYPKRRAEDRRSVIRKFNTLSKISVDSPFKEMHLWEWDFEIDIDETESRKMQ